MSIHKNSREQARLQHISVNFTGGLKEVYTGTKFQGRKEFDKLLRHVDSGDSIIFDSVSRMSRNSEEGFNNYEELYNRGINLIFLKEPHINTATYLYIHQTETSYKDADTGKNICTVRDAPKTQTTYRYYVKKHKSNEHMREELSKVEGLKNLTKLGEV